MVSSAGVVTVETEEVDSDRVVTVSGVETEGVDSDGVETEEVDGVVTVDYPSGVVMVSSP